MNRSGGVTTASANLSNLKCLQDLKVAGRKLNGSDLPIGKWAKLSPGSQLFKHLIELIGLRQKRLACAEDLITSLLVAWASGKRGVSYTRSKAKQKPEWLDWGLPTLKGVIEKLEGVGYIRNHIAKARRGGSGERSWVELTGLGAAAIARFMAPCGADILISGLDKTELPLTRFRKYSSRGKAPEFYEPISTDKIENHRTDMEFVRDCASKARVQIDPSDIESDNGVFMRVRNEARPEAECVSIPSGFDIRPHATFYDDAMTVGGRLHCDLSRLPRTARRKITINGHPVAEMDVEACHLTLLYHLVRANRPEAPYNIPGMSRAEAKTVIMTLIGSNCYYKSQGSVAKWLSERHPNQNPSVNRDEAEMLISMVCEFHSPIAQMFNEDMGFRLQAIEGHANLKALKDLAMLGIPAFTLHDSIIVPDTGNIADIAKHIFAKAFKTVTGGAKVKVVGKETERKTKETSYIVGRFLKTVFRTLENDIEELSSVYFAIEVRQTGPPKSLWLSKKSTENFFYFVDVERV